MCRYCYSTSGDGRPPQRQPTPFFQFPGMTDAQGRTCELWNAVLRFPACWDGDNLDSPNHKSHMAHLGDNRRCPSTHPFLLPELKLEIIFRLGDLLASAKAAGVELSIADFVVSTGDTSGASFHADFISGWDPAELGPMLDNCDFGSNVAGAATLCPVARYKNAGTPGRGTFTLTQLVPDEQVDNLQSLPSGSLPLVEQQVENGRMTTVGETGLTGSATRAWLSGPVLCSLLVGYALVSLTL